MKPIAFVTVVALLAGCATTPEEAASDRFEDCMNKTLGSFGPFTFGSSAARLKAAEICKEVMVEQPATAPPAK